MKRKKYSIFKSIIAAVLTAVSLFTLTGCFTKPPKDLYSLPQMSEEYLQLQQVINTILNAGASYSAPVAGLNRQSVQLEDLDGDGEREVIAFFSMTTGDKPLKIYIFKNVGGEYTEAARIEGEGTSIDSIYYADLDGDGVLELMVGWQIGAGVNMLSVYSIRGYQVTLLKTSAYTEYTVAQISEQSSSDIVVLKFSESDQTGVAEMFSFLKDGEIESYSADLSMGIRTISRVREGKLSDGAQALFVESELTGGEFIVTDIIVYDGAHLVNVTRSEETKVSDKTLRSSAYSKDINSRDINGDGIIETPNIIPLPKYSPDIPGTPIMVEWSSFSSNGESEIALSAYHNVTDGWYVILPDSWMGRFTVHREDRVAGERTIVFSLIDEDGQTQGDFLEIYMLSGDNKNDRAKLQGRFILGYDGDRIFAAKIIAASYPEDFGISEDLLERCFKISFPEWVTGAI